ncbi:unnamed protein product [Cylindrotheca closterium]|uniref:RING-type E3 ubiquitin transferase n=1 Tax=Cylindrotheca closterium TaxID=2856 RepID=A0AAD2CGG0_9STRA|nr:unnamed protein product [Cylindrotheca closterium]
MPVTAAMHHLRAWRDRQRARQDHERINTEEEEEEDEIVMTHPLEGAEEQQQQQPPALADSTSSSEEDDDDDDEDIENQRRTMAAPEDEGSSPTLASTVNARRSRGRRSSSTSLRRSRFTLEELEEERELARRRTSGCVLIAAFVLFRLWIQAVATSDFGLLLLCLVGTSWTARFIRHNREREEHLDRLIVESNENGGTASAGSGGGDMRILSFQAQLALAIIESQRQVMQGGYGHPDGLQNTPGVSEEAKEHWKKFPFKASEGLPDSCGHKSMGDDEEPHCSICLCEYEEKDDLVCLPCGHVYHGDCISSWCSNHQRCPLCNLDLESVTKEDDATSATTSS